MTTEPMRDDELQVAPSLVDFTVDDVECRDNVVEFNLVHKHDDDYHVTLLVNTVNKTSEYSYMPTNDPQDEQCFDYDYPESVGFAVVLDYHRVSVRKTQLIMLTEEQEKALNEWMHTDTYEDIPNRMAEAKENALIAKAESMIDDDY